MEEYIRRSQIFQKRLGTTPLPRKEEKYLLFRMAGPLMQNKLPRFLDLNKVPVTFLHGNPHLDNYVRTFRGSAMIDFDRSRMGPYCWDIIRFLSSLSLRRAENNGFLDRKVVEHFIDSYITHFLYPDIPSKPLKMLKNAQPEKWQVSTWEYLAGNKKWAKKMREKPLDPRSEFSTGLLKKFLESRDELSLLNRYRVEEVGEAPGSFGKRHYIFALNPIDRDSHEDSILLDIKEVYEEKDNRFFYSPFPHHGQRMIEAGKVYAPGMEERLGFCTFKNVQYWGRDIPSFAIKVKKFLNKDEQCDFACSVGSELGKGHFKGLKNPAEAEILEKDFTKNFDKYYKISKLFTYELNLAYESIRRKNQLYKDYRSW
ncbi:MAG TPA: DUF2252 family protein [Bacteriovoracaceae bacterium]|nr:DUF2252 family protein [Bacteriovoracaceae bacterium]